jgi:hypothetical protein
LAHSKRADPVCGRQIAGITARDTAHFEKISDALSQVSRSMNSYSRAHPEFHEIERRFAGRVGKRAKSDDN